MERTRQLPDDADFADDFMVACKPPPDAPDEGASRPRFLDLVPKVTMSSRQRRRPAPPSVPLAKLVPG